MKKVALENSEYLTVKKTEVPAQRRGGPGKWRGIFDSLQTCEAIRFEVESKEKARALGASIAQTIKISGADYRTSYRAVPGDSGYIIYIWKEAKK